MKQNGNVLIAQGGGPTAVINQTLAGIALEARKFPQVYKIYGALRGVAGIVAEDFIDLTQESSHNLEQVAMTPSSALLSTRVKPDEAYCREIFKVLKAHNIRYFFYIGGNDSADTVRIVNEQARLAKYDFAAIHVPKTIDNDLLVTDHTPGYGSAARFVSQAFAGLHLDVKALGGVYMGVVMGRNSGFLTAAAALSQVYEEDGPHLIYLPEREFQIQRFLTDIKQVYDRYGVCTVAISEGIRNASGQLILSTLIRDMEKDAHGNVTLSGTGALGDMLTQCVKENIKGLRVRCDTFGFLQRSFMGCVSDTDCREAREAGEAAVHFAVSNSQTEGSVTIHRIGNYAVEYRLTPLEDVAGKTKCMPDEFINQAGNHVTEAFKAYARPLIGSGLPVQARLRAPRVPKLLQSK
jgi:6-phosphofructokinase 1